MTGEDARIKARLSVQRALLGNVSANLRAVVLSINGRALEVRCYFDGVLQKADEETISEMETVMLADYDSEDMVTARCIRVDSPFPIRDDGIWVFRRKEGAA